MQGELTTHNASRIIAPMSRTASLIKALGWTQADMAEWLRCHQATVSRLVKGEPESGPISRLLDILEAQQVAEAPEAGDRDGLPPEESDHV
jgi:transcriptional regulator with XRE-family HTH domain